MPLARDIMTPGAACAAEQDTLEAAARKMADLNVGSLPILDPEQHLVGVVTDRDIVVKCVAQGRDPSGMTAGELVEGLPVTVNADDSIEHAISVMQRHRVRRLPVLRGETLVGILSQADIARYYPDYRVGDLIAAISS
ncbi:CBS domain-containing protein [Paenarthrobacter sp. DKR-5]|uniref:CBS domain-containing protein n=1 Tax=Paenarthrobacter sp. DKR-5 TaxID=2835535 RepID=UPI001BDC38F0|nr:CBS domain-containing protein [Paenarthrobacter sp. DKR-5]MBT1004289.1 CBS domain-containing protein [Paenarthrobacter sp. DKR-5]